MATILFKWFLIASLSLLPATKTLHPFFVSLTEIEYNRQEKILEISCKIFTDDFEKVLRMNTSEKIDLYNSKTKAAMGKQVEAYIRKHLKINVDDQPVQLEFIGYEIIEEGVYSYFQSVQEKPFKKINLSNNLLYEYKKEQESVMHITVNGKRKGMRLSNPESNAEFTF